MLELSENELLSTLKKNKNINIIADIITPFHLTSVIGFLYYMNDKLGMVANGIIRIHPHPRTGYAINNTINVKFGDVTLFYAKNENEGIINLIKECVSSLCKILKKKAKVSYLWLHQEIHYIEA